MTAKAPHSLTALLLAALLLAVTGRALAGPLEDGTAAYGRQDYKTALKLWQPLAESGDPSSQLLVGLLYEKGQGVAKSETAAAAWYRKSAEQGNLVAAVQLGTLYADGGPDVENFGEAARWYRVAAEEGNPRAEARLGKLYAAGLGVEKNEGRAAVLMHMAARQGDTLAENELAHYYEKGIGVHPDFAEGFSWRRRAADQGNRWAAASLGENIALSGAEARRLRDAIGAPAVSAVRQGDFKAAYRLTPPEERRHRIPCCDDPYASLQLRAALEGDAEAEFNEANAVHGDMPVTAYVWYSLAAAGGIAEAEGNRDGIAVSMSPGQLAEGQRILAGWKPLNFRVSSSFP